MSRQRRPSQQALAVLHALAMRPSQWRYGLSLSEETGLKSGTLYPLLIRLAEQNYLESQWLAPDPPGRPPRHAYRITNAGIAILKVQRRPKAALQGAN